LPFTLGTERDPVPPYNSPYAHANSSMTDPPVSLRHKCTDSFAWTPEFNTKSNWKSKFPLTKLPAPDGTNLLL